MTRQTPDRTYNQESVQQLFSSTTIIEEPVRLPRETLGARSAIPRRHCARIMLGRDTNRLSPSDAKEMDSKDLGKGTAVSGPSVFLAFCFFLRPRPLPVISGQFIMCVVFRNGPSSPFWPDLFQQHSGTVFAAFLKRQKSKKTWISKTSQVSSSGRIR